MPGYDGTGPSGGGPMTGRGLGYCVLKDSPQYNGAGLREYAGLSGQPVAPPGYMGYVGLDGRPVAPASLPAVSAYRRPFFFGPRFPVRRFGPGFGRRWGRGRGRGRGRFMGWW
jgi:hypothetical protein